MDDNSIYAEMHKIVSEKLEAGALISIDWLAQGIIAERCNIEGDDAEFYRVHTHRDLIRIAKRVIGKYNVDGETADQLVLPGFKHLCKAYPMSRDETIVLVPVSLCTNGELTARAAQLDEMAKGCRAHAVEIREYVLARGHAAAA